MCTRQAESVRAEPPSRYGADLHDAISTRPSGATVHGPWTPGEPADEQRRMARAAQTPLSQTWMC